MHSGEAVAIQRVADGVTDAVKQSWLTAAIDNDSGVTRL